MSEPLFSERHDPERREQFDSLHDGIPAFLFSSLLHWTMEHYSRYLSGKRVADRQAILRLERRIRRKLPSKAKGDLNELARAFRSDDALFLSAIDLVLRVTDHEFFEGPSPVELANILKEAGSVYCVGQDEDGDFQLQFRQSEEMIELIESEANQPGNAATHLRNAWSKCFGLDPDPKGACREAVEAVEVAAKPVVTPTDSQPSLGKMCGAIRDKPEKWETGSKFDRSIKTVRRMMELVWNDGRFRHGDESAPLEVSQEAAEMTVQTAVLLVSWFRSERIRLKR